MEPLSGSRSLPRQNSSALIKPNSVRLARNVSLVRLAPLLQQSPQPPPPPSFSSSPNVPSSARGINRVRQEKALRVLRTAVFILPIRVFYKLRFAALMRCLGKRIKSAKLIQAQFRKFRVERDVFLTAVLEIWRAAEDAAISGPRPSMMQLLQSAANQQSNNPRSSLQSAPQSQLKPMPTNKQVGALPSRCISTGDMDFEWVDESEDEDLLHLWDLFPRRRISSSRKYAVMMCRFRDLQLRHARRRCQGPYPPVALRVLKKGSPHPLRLSPVRFLSIPKSTDAFWSALLRGDREEAFAQHLCGSLSLNGEGLLRYLRSTPQLPPSLLPSTSESCLIPVSSKGRTKVLGPVRKPLPPPPPPLQLTSAVSSPNGSPSSSKSPSNTSTIPKASSPTILETITEGLLKPPASKSSAILLKPGRAKSIIVTGSSRPIKIPILPLGVLGDGREPVPKDHSVSFGNIPSVRSEDGDDGEDNLVEASGDGGSLKQKKPTARSEWKALTPQVRPPSSNLPHHPSQYFRRRSSVVRCGGTSLMTAVILPYKSPQSSLAQMQAQIESCCSPISPHR